MSIVRLNVHNVMYFIKMQVFKNFIAWLYNDYKVVKVIQGIWNLSVSSDFFDDYQETKNVRYEIKYSKIADKYILGVYGYKAKYHPRYENALEIFQEYETEHNNRKNKENN